jgi:phage nucleotide-binding protein
MAIKITTTKNYETSGVKILVHGPPGVGKTYLCRTAPKCLVISAEAGLLSLADVDIPVIEVKSVEDVKDAFQFCTESEEAEGIETIALDSITEIAEVLLALHKKNYKDPRQAYGQTNDDMATLIRSFRDIKGKNVYFSAKQQRVVDDDTGVTRYMPGMPGKTMLNAMSFYFDEVFALRLGQLEDGTIFRFLQTYPSLRIDAKDRSGKLPAKAKPDLEWVFNVIKGKEEK